MAVENATAKNRSTQPSQSRTDCLLALWQRKPAQLVAMLGVVLRLIDVQNEPHDENGNQEKSA
jgi:hypothetical protein